VLVKDALTAVRSGPAPTLSVVVVVVPPTADDVCRTQTVAFGATVLAVDVNVAVQPMEYSPPVTVIGEFEVKPVSVALADLTTVFLATLVWAGKLKASGVMSPAVVLVKVSLISVPAPTVSVVFVTPPGEAEDV
jgi:hypothetical protein